MPRTVCEIPILDEISYFGFSAPRCADLLKGEGDRVEVMINSPGGDVMEGLGIYNLLRAEKRPVRCTVVGVAASMASVIMMAADERVMWDNAILMIHDPSGLVMGTADDMRKQADVLDLLKTAAIAAYRRSGKSDEDLAAIMSSESWMLAPEALAAGFATKVIPAPKDGPTARWSADRSLARFAAPPPAARMFAQRPQKVPTSIVGAKKMPDVKRVQASLIALSGLLSLAREGADAPDVQEKQAFTDLATTLAPYASQLQALLPADQVPTATAFTDLMVLRATVEEVTGQKTGHAGAVLALAQNAKSAAQLGESAQRAQLLNQMIADRQIGPEERGHYAAKSLADLRTFAAIAHKDPLRKEPVQGGDQKTGATSITGEERPAGETDKASADAGNLIRKMSGYAPVGALK